MYVRTGLVTKTFKMKKLFISSLTYFCLISSTMASRDTGYGQGWTQGLNSNTPGACSPKIFPSCTQERCGSHTALLLNLGSNFAEFVLLVTSNLAFTCSALHTFPLQHQTCAYSLSVYLDNLITVMWIQIWEERSQGGYGQKILRLKNNQITGRLLASELITI